jgi:hypothetical protein
MKALLVVLIAFVAQPDCGAEQPAERLMLLFVPSTLHIKREKEPTNPLNPPEPQYYPLIPNRILDCLPGKLYDVRGFFEEEGAKFGTTGFAWYNPDAKLLAVRAGRADLEFVEQMLAGCYNPPVNLHVKGEAVVQSKGAGDVPPAQQVRWEIDTQPSQRAVVSASGGALGYSYEFEPIMHPDGKFIGCSMAAKVTFDGREYSATTSATIALSKPYSLLLGTTPSGDEVRLQLRLDVQQPVPPSPLDDPATEKRLRECIERALRKQ